MILNNANKHQKHTSSIFNSSPKMSQCVPSWDLDDNPPSPRLSLRSNSNSNSNSTAPDVPMLVLFLSLYLSNKYYSSKLCHTLNHLLFNPLFLSSDAPREGVRLVYKRSQLNCVQHAIFSHTNIC